MSMPRDAAARALRVAMEGAEKALVERGDCHNVAIVTAEGRPVLAVTLPRPPHGEGLVEAFANLGRLCAAVGGDTCAVVFDCFYGVTDVSVARSGYRPSLDPAAREVLAGHVLDRHGQVSDLVVTPYGRSDDGTVTFAEPIIEERAGLGEGVERFWATVRQPAEPLHELVFELAGAGYEILPT